MKLEFLDGSQIDVLTIIGGPRLIMGTMRDTLRIEVSPETIGFDELKSHFKDNPKTGMLYTYTDNTTTDEDGNVVTELIKNEIGEGYKIFVSISDEERKVASPPGRLLPDRTEEVYIVTIAQLTYQEYNQSLSDQVEESPTKE